MTVQLIEKQQKVNKTFPFAMAIEGMPSMKQENFDAHFGSEDLIMKNVFPFLTSEICQICAEYFEIWVICLVEYFCNLVPLFCLRKILVQLL